MAKGERNMCKPNANSLDDSNFPYAYETTWTIYLNYGVIYVNRNGHQCRILA